MKDGRHQFQEQRSLFFLQKQVQTKDLIILYLGLLPLPDYVGNSKRYFSITYTSTRGDEYLTERQKAILLHYLGVKRQRIYCKNNQL